MLGKRLEPFKTAALGRMRTAAFFVLLAFGCGGVAFPLFGQTTEVGKSAPEAQSTNTSYVLIPNDLIRVAIGLAGDFTNLANQEKVTVKRMVGGQEKVFTENVQAMMRDINAKPFLIIPGDVIVVKQTLF
ncbi:MAG: hypothetical protein EB082_08250 [Verrucomicrobia bacterium]|nr:hypothetical protein [Verrucomicrobiota bacterium]